MQAIVLHRDVAPALAETRKTLLDAAHRRFGALPGELVVEHLLDSAGGTDFAVREAALDALRRRWEFARRDELRLVRRPPNGNVFGAYTTARSGGARTKVGNRRPYTTVLESIAPLRGSCDCADFVRSSLGLCKHLLVVLDHVFSSRRLVAKAAKEAPARALGPLLSWDPRLPLTGGLDRAAGLRLLGSDRSSRLRRSSKTDELAALARAFPDASPDPRLLADPNRRRDLLTSLKRAATPGSRGRPLISATPGAR